MGERLMRSRIEKVFRIENEKLSRQFQEILENIPLEHMQLTSDIITYAKKNLNVQLNQSIYITLTDHINFAIQRQAQGIQLKNALLWEIKKFYHQEYLMGKYAINLLNEKLGTKFSEDEAGFIALHFVNAEYDTTINDTFAMTNMIQGILELVKQEMGIEFDEESLHYERFVTHLKFLAQRLYRHELLKDEEIEFAKLMEGKYPGEYECSKHIAEYIEKEYGGQISGEEIMFLAIHIKRDLHDRLKYIIIQKRGIKVFDFLKKKDKGIEIGAPVKGKAVPISQVSDPTFGEEILGKGVAIQPADGKIYAPADGTIEMLFDTKHAVSMTTTEGVELLVHIGLDTVALKGEHFTAHKGNGDAVKKGDLLISVDLEAVKAAGYDVITPMVVCNTSDYQTVEAVTGSDVNPGDTVLILKK